MRAIPIFAAVASMIGVWIIAFQLSKDPADRLLLAGATNDAQHTDSPKTVGSTCRLIGQHAQTYDCEIVGNPNADRWPEPTAEHAYARSVWDMETATIGGKGERIYFGGGDWGLNQGPVPIWSLYWQKPKEENANIRIAQEQPVYGEAIEFFREIDGRLYVPDIDPKDPWAYGNIYALDNDGWFKYRNLEHAVHVFDVIGFQGAIVASAGVVENSNGFAGLYRSTDNGVSWMRLPVSHGESRDAYRYWRMAEFGEGLFVAQSSARNGYWTLDKNWHLQFHDTDLFPDMGDADLRLTVSRAVPFGGDVLYTPKLDRMPINPQLRDFPLAPIYQSNVHFRNWWDKIIAAWSFTHRNLYRLTQNGNVDIVKIPGRPHINDVLILEGEVYVLGTSFDAENYQAIILSSSDLENWNEVQKIETQAIAYSFEYLDGEWFLGLAADGMTDNNISSGEIIRIYSNVSGAN
ncbi:hypothetical protein [Hyphococcus sp. DH-69]|uniref:hypothetical protein n=1 Tax=Hyphococcus formosus TaxID=3143534 RepID=UPI00398B215A